MDAGAAGNDQRVDGALVEWGGDDLQPALGPHRARMHREDVNDVRRRRADHAAGTEEDLVRAGHVERLDAVVGEDHDPSAGRGGHGSILGEPRGGVKDTMPTFPATLTSGRSAGTVAPVDVRIGVTQAPRELTVEMPDEERDDTVKQVEAALSGAVDVLWLTDKRGRRVGVPAEKIAYIELGANDGDRRIGFGG